MGWANKLIGWASGNGAEVSAANELKVVQGELTSGVRVFSENDPGDSLGVPFLASTEVDNDFRARASLDRILHERNYTGNAQNFTSEQLFATTYVPNFTTTGFNTNPSLLTTAAAAMLLRTYKTFPLVGTETLSRDLEGAFNFASGSAVPANVIIEFGFGLTAVATPYDAFDAIYMRTNNSGTVGVIRNNSSVDTAVSNLFKAADGVTTWFPVSGRKYQFIIYESPRQSCFWINDPLGDGIFLAAVMPTPIGFGAPRAASASPVFLRQFQPSAPPVACSFNLSRDNVRTGGQNIASTLPEFNARATEDINSPGTLTTTANQAIASGSITRPAAAVPTNTAALVTSLSGMVLETATLAAGTDGILMAYQNPALPTAVAATFTGQRRLRIDGVRISTSVQTALTGGGVAKHYYLAYGSTSVSLQGVAADTATSKAYRRVQLELVQAFAAAAAAGSIPQQNGGGYLKLRTPVYINPGEFVALATYHIGSVPSAGVFQHGISFDATPE